MAYSLTDILWTAGVGAGGLFLIILGYRAMHDGGDGKP